MRRGGLLRGGALAAVALAAAAVGAGIGHELWVRTTQDQATVGVQSNAVGSSRSAGGQDPYTGSGFTPGAAGDPYNGFPSFGPGGFPSFGPGGSFNPGGLFGPGEGAGSGSRSASGATATGAPADASSLAAKVDPGLVDVNSTFSYQSDAGEGTGIVLTANGEVLTNNHVVEGATRITVTDIGNGKTYDATVVGYDTSHDVAVLQLKDASGLQTAKLGDSSKLAVGDAVVGVGNAGGVGGTPSYAGGEITGLGKAITASGEIDGSSEQLTGLVETNAPIEPGDSGGPLVDSAGQVIGMDTAGSGSSFYQSAFQSSTTNAFAIPIDQALALATQIEAGQAGSSTVHIGATPFLGVLVGSAGTSSFGSDATTATGSGVPVQRVITGEPAQLAGLASGDLITALDGQAVSSDATLSKLILGHHPGDKISLTWKDSSGATHTASVSLAAGPAA